MGLEVGGLLGLIWLVLVIWAIIKVANSPPEVERKFYGF